MSETNGLLAFLMTNSNLKSQKYEHFNGEYKINEIQKDKSRMIDIDTGGKNLLLDCLHEIINNFLFS